MSAIPAALATAVALGGAGAAAGLALPYRPRVPVVGVLTAGVGVAGVVAGAAALSGSRWAAVCSGLVPPAGAQVAVDALAGLFMAVAGAVVAAVAVYGIGYAAGRGAGGLGSRTAQAVLPLFALSLVLVPVAASVSTFLLLWEVSALGSLLLVLGEHQQHASVRQAGVWYAVLTHLGLVLLLAGFSLFAARAGGETFTALRAGAPGVPAGVRGLVFALLALAFTSKAGAVPLHAWLPRAYPEAPGPVAALMSAATVNLGIYGLVRTASICSAVARRGGGWGCWRWAGRVPCTASSRRRWRPT
ncbi:proton-conducting transporter membrane subunit [Streptomyces sp. CoH27]|uniref:proton-conducting transporter transmembrane domain-containing protein n=1 Tax=Streptomyces sp. CoH27 TaxID=2875763 RepID=UPI0027E14EF4|nr:proton-conducting transporter membrane subunit [Streptomyces sp. CoH27]